jgi:hypothetical protein
MDWQVLVSLLAVAIASGWLVRRSISALRGRANGCGGCQGCAGDAADASRQPVRRQLYTLPLAGPSTGDRRSSHVQRP